MEQPKANDTKTNTKSESDKDVLAHNEAIINREIKLQSSDLNEDVLDNLAELNLHNCELTSLNVESLKSLRFLKRLTLSFNKLKNLKELNNIVSLIFFKYFFYEIWPILVYCFYFLKKTFKITFDKDS